MAEATSATPANKEAVVAGVRAGVMLVGDGVEEGSRFAHPIPDPAHPLQPQSTRLPNHDLPLVTILT